MNVIWSEIFETGKIPSEMPDAHVCAFALESWGNCMAGNKPPDNFGEVMVQVGVRLGSSSPDSLMKLSEKFLGDAK